MSLILRPPTTIEQLSDLCTHEGEQPFLAHIGNVGVLIRLDERGGDGEPVPWAFKEGAAPEGFSRQTQNPTSHWDELLLNDDENDDPDQTEEITDELGLGFPIPPSKGAATVFILPNIHERTEISVGRNEENHIQINERSVSRKHAVLELLPDINGFYVNDHQSRNGVKVRGRIINNTSPMKTRHGDTLGIGDILFLYLSAEQLKKNLHYFTD